jgi:hypothetical protein
MDKLRYSLLIILTIVSIQAQTLPPLPIDSLKKIELKYSYTLIKPVPIDTLHLNLFGGNIFGGRFFLLHPINKKCLLNTNLEGAKDFDYSNYYYGNGKINFGWLTKNFWQEFELRAFWKKRELRYCQELSLAYNPIWFISNGTLTFNNELRGTKYIDTETNLLLAGWSDWNFNMPSPIGIIDGEANILAQAIRRDNYKYWTFSTVALTDLITISDNFYTQPGVNYNIEKNQIEPKVDIGIFIANTKILLNLSHHTIKPFYFDTLYNNIYPLLVFDSIDYPLCIWQAGFELSWQDLVISANYERYNSYIRYSSRDTWIIPQFIESRHTALNFGIEYSRRFLKNNFYIYYTPDEINLIPQYTISDSMLINLGRFGFGLVGFYSSQRIFDNQTLNSYIILSSEIGFNWRSVRPYVKVDNILDNRYEILPARFALGRKYFIGLEYNHKNKSRVK